MEGGRQCECAGVITGVCGGRRAASRREAYGEKTGVWWRDWLRAGEKSSSKPEEKAGRERQRRGKSKPANHEAESAYVTGAGGAG